MFNQFFKSVTVYRYELGGEETIAEDEMLEFVGQLKHVEIKPSQKEAFGFSSVVGYHDPELFLYRIQDWLLLSMTIEEKKLDKNKLERKVALEKREAEKKKGVGQGDLTKPEISQIRDKVYAEMLSEKEANEDYLNILLDTRNQWIYFNDPNPKRIKKFVTLMQKKFSGFRISEFCTHGLELHLTSWLYDGGETLPEEIELEDSASLKSEQSSNANLSKQNLQSEEIITLINHGKKCLEVSVSYLERISFKLTANCQLKSIKLSDLFLSSIDLVEEPDDRVHELLPFWEAMCSELTSIFLWLDKLQHKPV